jgi:hypothetical protein
MRKRSSYLLFPLVLALAALAIVALRGGSSSVAQGGPPGNNGTVKVDDQPLDSIPNNNPHVGCSFRVDFAGFDEGDLTGSATFFGVPPTGGGFLGGDTVAIGGDPAGGATDFDGSVSVDLSSALANITPHPQQGWHVRLVVHAEGSQGADTKFKTFWVTGCEAPPPPPTTPPPGGDDDDEPGAPPAQPVPGQPGFTG